MLAPKGGAQDAVAGAIDHGGTPGVRDLCPRRREPTSPRCAATSGSAPRPATSGWRGRRRGETVGRSLAPSAHLAAAHHRRRWRQPVLALRAAHPAWGGRKLHHRLARQGVVQPPAPEHDHRHPAPPRPARPEPPPPRLRALRARGAQRPVADWTSWATAPCDHGRVHPLTLLDDHSRFVLRAGRLCQRAAGDRPGAPDRRLPPLRAAARPS